MVCDECVPLDDDRMENALEESLRGRIDELESALTTAMRAILHGTKLPTDRWNEMVAIDEDSHDSQSEKPPLESQGRRSP